VRACVISLGDQRSYFLSTAREDLGVRSKTFLERENSLGVKSKTVVEGENGVQSQTCIEAENGSWGEGNPEGNSDWELLREIVIGNF